MKIEMSLKQIKRMTNYLHFHMQARIVHHIIFVGKLGYFCFVCFVFFNIKIWVLVGVNYLP